MCEGVCVIVCVCVRERERERQIDRQTGVDIDLYKDMIRWEGDIA